MKKKIISLMLVGLTLATSIPVFAASGDRATLAGDSSTESVEYYNETTDYNQEEENRPETEITLTTTESFSVIIPKLIVIAGEKDSEGEYQKTYDITVKGDIDGEKYVKVEAPKATLHNGGKTALTVDMNSKNELIKVVQNDGAAIDGFINVSSEDMITGKTTEYNAKVENKDDVSAGEYTGTVKFDIGLFYR